MGSDPDGRNWVEERAEKAPLLTLRTKEASGNLGSWLESHWQVGFSVW